MDSPHLVPPAARRFLVVLAALALLAVACGGDGSAGSATEDDTSTTTPSVTTSSTGEVDAGGETTTTDSDDGEAADGDTTDGDATDGDTAEDPAWFDELVWTVMAVDWDDELNVRADPDPGAEIVATLAPWSQAFTGLAKTVDVDGARWRMVETDDGTTGWVNARYIVAQPAELTAVDEAVLADATSGLVYWALAVDDHGAAPRLADRALWVGGIGVYADFPMWSWIPAAQADESAEWTTTRTFDLDLEVDGYECGSDCDKTIVEFLHFDQLGDEWRVAVESDLDPETNGFIDGPFADAPDGFHRAVIDKPASEGVDADGNPMIELDWQRIHVVHDWSTADDGDPRLFLINTWGWTP